MATLFLWVVMALQPTRKKTSFEMFFSLKNRLLVMDKVQKLSNTFTLFSLYFSFLRCLGSCCSYIIIYEAGKIVIGTAKIDCGH
jgi:hypothetical protein